MRLRAVFWSVALAALGYLGLSLWAGWRELVAAVAGVGPFVLLGLLGLSLTNYLLRFLRWSNYLALLGHPVPWRINLDIYFSGFALTTSPGKLGEMLRSVLLKAHGVPPAASVAAFFAERLSDLLAILMLTALGVWTYAPARPVVAFCLAAIVVALLLVQQDAWLAAIERWAAARPQKWAQLLVKACEMILHFRRCFSLKAMSAALAIGVLAWFAEGAGFAWLVSALGYPLPLSTAVFIYAFAMLIGGLSFLPGGLGGSEAVMITLLALNGLPASAAITATLICRLATLWFAVAIGAILLARHR